MPVKNEALLPLFDEAKQLLVPYASRGLKVRKDEPGYYDLWSKKDIEFAGRKKKEMFFAGLIVQKSFVGFYFMPVYTDEEAKDFFGPELMPLLKGKSCFRLKRMTPGIRGEMTDALARGYELYRERGWIGD